MNIKSINHTNNNLNNNMLNVTQQNNLSDRKSQQMQMQMQMQMMQMNNQNQNETFNMILNTNNSLYPSNRIDKHMEDSMNRSMDRND